MRTLIGRGYLIFATATPPRAFGVVRGEKISHRLTAGLGAATSGLLLIAGMALGGAYHGIPRGQFLPGRRLLGPPAPATGLLLGRVPTLRLRLRAAPPATGFLGFSGVAAVSGLVLGEGVVHEPAIGDLGGVLLESVSLWRCRHVGEFWHG
jgi:hypothetical protein